MAVSEPDRHELYQALEETIGKRPTETMMGLLPPTGWGEVATRKDLEAMEARVNERIIRTALAVNIPSIFAAVGLAFTAARLG